MNDIIDVKVKEILDTKTEEFLSLKKEEFFGFAKKTVESYLETGRILCEVNEKLASTDRRTNRWSTWLEEIGVPGRSAREIMQVYRKYGSVGAVTAVTSSTILVALSSPSADPELVSEVESRILSGETLTVAKVKEELKKAPPEVREAVAESVQNVAKATAEVYEEEFYGMTREELDADMEQRLKEHKELYKDAEATKIAAKKETKASFIERVMVAKEEMGEIHRWIENAQKFYREHGVEPPRFELEGNSIYNEVQEEVEV